MLTRTKKSVSEITIVLEINCVVTETALVVCQQIALSLFSKGICFQKRTVQWNQPGFDVALLYFMVNQIYANDLNL